jgi:hypothetical protein
MPWYPRSLADRDTHHGEYSGTARSVRARCGIEFVPLKLADGAPLALPGDPPDPEQICPQCYRSKPTS